MVAYYYFAMGLDKNFAEILSFTFSNMKLYHDLSLSFCTGFNLDSPMILFVLLPVWRRLPYMANMTWRI